MTQEQFSVSLLVANQYGVLTRVAGLFARRGFNIDSLTVGETQDSRLSRMTITAKGDDYIKEQVVKQLAKLEDVKLVAVNETDRTALRELLMIKISLEGEELNELLSAANIFEADVVDLSDEYVVLGMMSRPAKLDSIIAYFDSKHGIVELTRTGPAAMGRGDYKLATSARNGKHALNNNGKHSSSDASA